MAPPGNQAFEALADPTRRAILHLLSGRDEATAGEIAGGISSVGRTTVSSHLRILRSSGLVTERRAGRYRYYAVDPGPADEVVAFLAGLYRGALSDLRRALESDAEHRAP